MINTLNVWLQHLTTLFHQTNMHVCILNLVYASVWQRRGCCVDPTPSLRIQSSASREHVEEPLSVNALLLFLKVNGRNKVLREPILVFDVYVMTRSQYLFLGVHVRLQCNIPVGLYSALPTQKHKPGFTALVDCCCKLPAYHQRASRFV